MRAPGFIDLQVNGYCGIDFSDPETCVDDILESAEMLWQSGAAGFLATIITSPKPKIEHCVETIRTAINKQGRHGNLLGIHLEGPFISSEYGYRGMHPEESIYPPDLDWFSKLQKIGGGSIRLITLAPEQTKTIEFIQSVTPEVTVSVGHSNSSYKTIKKAVDAGLTMATHIGNGCRQMIDRHNNPIFNILAFPEILLSFIPDGFHLPESFIKVLINSRPIEKLIVVSDSMKYAGMDPGEYENDSGVKISLGEDGGLCLVSDPNILAGSSFNMLQCMNHLAALNILDEDSLWAIGFFNPLRVLGLDSKEFAKRGNMLSYDVQIRWFNYDS